ncbi:MAG: hypothetical protein ACP5NX_03825 [Candidatus Bilamarchaeaceae archaeon]
MTEGGQGAAAGFSRGQVSTELLIVVATVLVLFIPLIFVLYLQANSYSAQLDGYKTELAVVRLASLVNSVGNMGEGSYVLAEIYVPDGISLNGAVSPDGGKGSEIIFISTTSDGESQIVRPVEFKIDGPVPRLPGPGYFRLEIRNTGGKVKICQDQCSN